MTQYFLTLPHDTAEAPTMESMDPAVLEALVGEVGAFIGGFWIIEAPDRATALTWAERCSAAVQSRIEVRALQEGPPE